MLEANVQSRYFWIESDGESALSTDPRFKTGTVRDTNLPT